MNKQKKQMAIKDAMDIGKVIFGTLTGAAVTTMVVDKKARNDFMGAVKNLISKTPVYNKIPMGADARHIMPSGAIEEAIYNNAIEEALYRNTPKRNKRYSKRKRAEVDLPMIQEEISESKGESVQEGIESAVSDGEGMRKSMPIDVGETPEDTLEDEKDVKEVGDDGGTSEPQENNKK